MKMLNGIRVLVACVTMVIAFVAPAAAEELVVTETGNVGIGVEAPQYKLHLVNGRVCFDSGFGGNTVNYDIGAKTYQYTLEANEYNLLLKSLAGTAVIGVDRANGTVSAPAPLVDENFIFKLYTSGTNQNLTQSYTTAINIKVDGAPVGNTVNQKMYLMNGKISIRASGNVGIGTLTPQDKLDVNGYIRANGTRLTSDARWKENIETIDDSLDRVIRLRGVSYDWVDPSRGQGRQIGVIAQEVEQIFPEVVHTDSQGYKSVEYAKIVAPLIEAIKALKAENERLAARVAALEKRGR